MYSLMALLRAFAVLKEEGAKLSKASLRIKSSYGVHGFPLVAVAGATSCKACGDGGVGGEDGGQAGERGFG